MDNLGQVQHEAQSRYTNHEDYDYYYLSCSSARSNFRYIDNKPKQCLLGKKQNNWSISEFNLFGNITSKYYFINKFLTDIIYSHQEL